MGRPTGRMMVGNTGLKSAELHSFNIVLDGKVTFIGGGHEIYGKTLRPTVIGLFLETVTYSEQRELTISINCTGIASFEVKKNGLHS